MEINVEERVARAKDLFRSGYNCCQSVALAYADLTGLDEMVVATMSAPFGGGMGRLREVCGAVSGMTLLSGFIAPSPANNDIDAKRRNYALVQEFAEAFRAEMGHIVCRQLLGIDHEKDNPAPSPRTAEYYRKRPCVEYVGYAARIVGEYLTSQTDTSKD